MHGNTVGSLNVYRYTTPSDRQNLWTKSGAQGNQWLQALVTIQHAQNVKVCYHGNGDVTIGTPPPVTGRISGQKLERREISGYRPWLLYNMHRMSRYVTTVAVGSLYRYTTPSDKQNLWTKTGVQGNQWLQALVTIQHAPNVEVRYHSSGGVTL